MIVAWLVHRIACTLSAHSDTVSGVDLSMDMRHAASGSLDRTIHYWDLSRGASLRTYMFHSQCYGLRMDSAGHLCVSAHMDGKLRFWDLRQNSYDAISELPSHSGQCTGSIKGMSCRVVSCFTSPLPVLFAFSLHHLRDKPEH